MKSCSYRISGGDYANAGAASSDLKAVLKRIGVEPAAIRRTIIAAYEAETNVVIHALRGEMRVTIGPGQIDVEVDDDGPGIPDIAQAMKEGFSTAPAAARELGFGAGMGLPNIRKSSDRFVLESTVGQGTRLRFTVHLKAHAVAAAAGNGMRISPERCTGCLRCLRVCPTQALRVRRGTNAPAILEHLCINCAECIAACASGALAMSAAAELPDPKGRSLLIPSSFLYQFGAGIGPESVRRALTELGFAEVRELGPWHEALRRATEQYAAHSKALPVISPACLAVVNLIEMRFPSLIRNLAPFLSPIEAACRDWAAEGKSVMVASCPAERAALLLRPATERLEADIIPPALLAQKVMPLVAAKRGAESSSASLELKNGNSRTTSKTRTTTRTSTKEGVLEVTGIRHVVRVLEEVENGLLPDVRVLELFACEQGCFGSPLLKEDAFISRHRARSGTAAEEARAVRREKPFTARAGLRLDEDMAKAMAKLSEIERLRRTLPGKDCALCGAPTCDALAEDVVLGRTACSISDCRTLTKK
ncbi:MAG: [Fe-Fe] hydrogenase large subunit C-terminal domain-containing protein [Candidatus Brocadiia bacterium]|jgi:anti-sigma regulatory factor (Ser/Thr protein kinase)/NAD-dependent dihydropyrimidine dehydrogenase PreA subunit